MNSDFYFIEYAHQKTLNILERLKESGATVEKYPPTKDTPINGFRYRVRFSGTMPEYLRFVHKIRLLNEDIKLFDKGYFQAKGL